MAGAPVGNQNAAKGKKWQAAINRALDTRSRVEGREMLDVLANELINQALAGEQWAFAQLGDRLDGKPHQTLEAEVSGNLAGVLAGLGNSASTGEDPPVAG